MPGAFRAGNPLRQGTCSGVSYAKKNYLCMDTNITTMKVLLINGSPHREGNTFIALSEVARTLEAQGIGTEIVHIGTRAMQGCIACGKCAELGHCVFSDAVYTAVREKLAEADGLVVGSPVYYAGPNGSLCALLDRVFYSCGRDLAYKPGRCRGCLPPWRGERDVRPPEQVFYDFEYARRAVAVLEQRTRTGAGRSTRRCRRLADDAGAGEEHGATAEGRRRPPSGPGTRRTGVDAFHPLTAAGLDFRMGKSAQKSELATTNGRCQFTFNV